MMNDYRWHFVLGLTDASRKPDRIIPVTKNSPMQTSAHQTSYIPMNSPTPQSNDDFAPHVTVATVIEKNNRFLLVEERSGGKVVLNQPAGHLDPDEDLIQAAKRETLEETGWHVDITGVLGIQLYRSPNNGVTYHRTTFIGSPVKQEPEPQLDEGIIATVWMTAKEMQAEHNRHRSPLVMRAVEEYLKGTAYPVSMLSAHL